jgi:hypothetical protein
MQDRGLFTGDLFGGGLGQAAEAEGTPKVATQLPGDKVTPGGQQYSPFVQQSQYPPSYAAESGGGTDVMPYVAVGVAAVVGLGIVWMATRRPMAANRRRVAKNRRRSRRRSH